jgi:hypothetical protein
MTDTISFYFIKCHTKVTTSEPKREEVKGDWRKLHNENLQNFYFLPLVVMVIKLKRMR